MPYARIDLSKIVVAAVLWGTTGVVVALLRDRTALSPTAIGFHRLALSAAALILFLAAARRLAPLIRVFRTAPATVLLTGVFLGGYQALYFIAVVEAGVSVATVVSLGIAPVLTTVWEAFRARVRPGPRIVATVTAALAGLILISVASADPSTTAPRPLLGLLVAVGSGVGYGVSTLLSRDLSQRGDALTLTAATSAVGAVALLPLCAGALAFPVRADTAGMLVYLGVVTTAVAYALFYGGLRTVPGSVASVLTLLEPLTAALLAVVVLGEPLPALTVLGGVLMLTAVAVLYARPRRVTGSRQAAAAPVS